MKPSSARCAIDCALWDIEAKEKNKRIWDILKIKKKASTSKNSRKLWN